MMCKASCHQILYFLISSNALLQQFAIFIVSKFFQENLNDQTQPLQLPHAPMNVRVHASARLTACPGSVQISCNKFEEKSKKLRSSDGAEQVAVSDQEALRHLTLGFASLWAKQGENNADRKVPYACDLYLLAKKHSLTNKKSKAEQQDQVGEKKRSDVAQDLQQSNTEKGSNLQNGQNQAELVQAQQAQVEGQETQTVVMQVYAEGIQVIEQLLQIVQLDPQNLLQIVTNQISLERLWQVRQEFLEKYMSCQELLNLKILEFQKSQEDPENQTAQIALQQYLEQAPDEQMVLIVQSLKEILGQVIQHATGQSGDLQTMAQQELLLQQSQNQAALANLIQSNPQILNDISALQAALQNESDLSVLGLDAEKLQLLLQHIQGQQLEQQQVLQANNTLKLQEQLQGQPELDQTAQLLQQQQEIAANLQQMANFLQEQGQTLDETQLIMFLQQQQLLEGRKQQIQNQILQQAAQLQMTQDQIQAQSNNEQPANTSEVELEQILEDIVNTLNHVEKNEYTQMLMFQIQKLKMFFKEGTEEEKKFAREQIIQYDEELKQLTFQQELLRQQYLQAQQQPQQQAAQMSGDQKTVDEYQKRLFIQQMNSNNLAQQKLDQYLNEQNENLAHIMQNHPEQLQGLFQQRQMFGEMNKKLQELLDKSNNQNDKSPEQSPAKLGNSEALKLQQFLGQQLEQLQNQQQQSETKGSQVINQQMQQRLQEQFQQQQPQPLQQAQIQHTQPPQKRSETHLEIAHLIQRDKYQMMQVNLQVHQQNSQPVFEQMVNQFS